MLARERGFGRPDRAGASVYTAVCSAGRGVLVPGEVSSGIAVLGLEISAHRKGLPAAKTYAWAPAA